MVAHLLGQKKRKEVVVMFEDESITPVVCVLYGRRLWEGRMCKIKRR